MICKHLLKSLNYKLFKKSLSFEEYLLNLLANLSKKYCMFRTGNTKLPIETGRWFNTPRENRICKLCNSKKIGDEFHYLLKCTYSVIQTSRIQNLSKYYQSNPNIIKF